jgi:PKD repeat protein
VLGTLALLAALAAGAQRASAVIVHLDNGRTISYMPLRGPAPPRLFDPFFENLDYNGGPVMPSNTNYTVYWSPTGKSAYPEGYISGIDTYLKDLAHDSGGSGNVDSVSTQYNDSEGHVAAYSSHFGESLIDEDPYPKNGCKHAAICLTDKQLQEELEKFVEKEKKPINLETEYFMLTPKGVESCFEETGAFAECSAGAEEEKNRRFCAYHSNFEVAGAQLIYANDPYVVGIIPGCEDGKHPNNSPSDGALEGGLSHEHNESTTDPEPNSAWTFFAPEQGEIGDKCAGLLEPAIGEVEIGPSEFVPFNQEINGHKYWYQEEWSNQGNRCMQRLAFKGSAPVAAFTATPTGPNEIAFDASPSTGAVTHYSWQFNDEPEPDVAFSPTPTITHKFPLSETFTVALTVFAGDGTSDGTGRAIEVGAPAPSASFSPPSGKVGQSLSFSGSGSDPGHSITAFSWSFGDGASATGASTSHAYGAPGTFEAKLTVTSTSGLSAIVGHPVTVEPAEAAGGGPVAVAAGSAGAPTATIAVLASSGRVRRGQTAVKLSCHGSAPRCSGRLVLSAVRIVHRGGRTLRRKVTIATASFNIASGATAIVQLHLNQLGRSLLRSAAGHLGTTLAIVRSSPAPSVTQTRRLRLHR